MDMEVLTIRELATYLKMAEKTLYRLTAQGKIPGFKVGGAWRFRKTEVDRWIKEQELSNKKSDGGNAL
ncbi:MAG: helix-turn-helix domain-containing protein [Alphaproteobacteria bacterium]|nr:helix-turn-helix domain-containing protein [Alphaproteobacteria bacterium]MCK5556461.1 helix-turn-helix domain-containing protein [Alphaproteobacteria bacterium]MCK5659511.1 helix-turn-helix domain-containing protein [Alphaproteobacteria bacterium]